ncbi:MAG: hypothetical protein V7767_05810, partial [Leeuwenhoekiella sp.]
IKALIAYGEDISKELLYRESEKLLKSGVKKHIPKIIEKFRTQPSVKVLIKLLRSRDILIRLSAAKSLHKLKGKESKLNFYPKIINSLILTFCKEYEQIVQAKAVIREGFNPQNYLELLPQDDLTELSLAHEGLIESLDLQLDQRLETLFKLLGVYYNKKDMDVAYGGLMSRLEDTRANAIEFLDNILSPKLKESFLPILETNIISEQHQDEDIVLPYTFQDALIYLLREGDGKIRLSVIYLIQYLGDTAFLEPLYELLKTAKNRDVRSFAALSIKKLQANLIGKPA